MIPSARYNIIVPTAYGTMIVNRNDYVDTQHGRIGVGWELMQSGRYAQVELDNLAGLVRGCAADPVAFDIGANIGVHSLWLSSLVGPNGRVHAFEAQRVIYQMLMGNLAINSVENVFARQLALGAAPGTLRLPPTDYARPWSFGSMSLAEGNIAPQFASGAPEGARPGEEVAIVTLDSLAPERVDLLKIDVEGMELDVLKGGADTIERARPLMQVEWVGDDNGAVPAYLIDDLGYRVYQSAINLICIPAERSELQLSGAVEITLDGLRATFRLP